MPRYNDRHGTTRLYVGHLSSRTRSRDLEDIFSRYGRIRDVDMKRDFAFVEFKDPRDADDARYSLNGRDVDGSRIVVEFAKGVPQGGGGGGGYGGSREFLGRGPPPGSGRCFNCGLDGHWARDCKAGDWKNKCYRCGEQGHIERNCQNSPKKVKHGRSYSCTPSPPPRHGRNQSRSVSRSRSRSRSRSPAKRERSVERAEKRSRSPRRNRASPQSSKGRKHSPSPSPTDHARRSKAASRSPVEDDVRSPDNRSTAEENGHSRSPSPVARDNGTPIEDEDVVNNGSPDPSESG